MATKQTPTYVHPSRREQIPDEPRRKRQKPNNAGPKSFKKAHPVNDLKSQIRSLKRLLERDDKLPADVRVEKERALRTVRHELDEAQKAQKRSDIIGRYHKIRFFDRQKAEKRLKRARKELDGCADGDDRRVELETAVEHGEVDVNYAQYYPLDRHYVSLFPRKRPKENENEEIEGEAINNESAVERHGDPEMWEKVKKCMVDGTLEALRNGKLTEPKESVAAEKRQQKTEEGMYARSEGDKSIPLGEFDQKEHEEANNESDGFFE